MCNRAFCSSLLDALGGSSKKRTDATDVEAFSDTRSVLNSNGTFDMDINNQKGAFSLFLKLAKGFGEKKESVAGLVITKMATKVFTTIDFIDNRLKALANEIVTGQDGLMQKYITAKD